MVLKIPKAKIKPPMPPIMSMPTEMNMPTKMRIKTIAKKDPELFDYEVNELLEKGWTLVDRRIVIPSEGKVFFYAELEKLSITNLDICLKGEKVGEI